MVLQNGHVWGHNSVSNTRIERGKRNGETTGKKIVWVWFLM